MILLFARHGGDVNFSPDKIAERLNSSVNLIPFYTTKSYLKAFTLGNISKRLFLMNILGNLVLFLPMGRLLPVVTRITGFFRVIGNILLIILSVECIQLLTGLGRFDVDDIILNISGAVVGYILFALSKSQVLLKKKKTNK